jgi:predicted glycogen debranching enzyme
VSATSTTSPAPAKPAQARDPAPERDERARGSTATATSTATPILVPGEVCRDFSRSSRLEWLETNGLGGFAMGTASGANTRRYHGLLVAALRPPVERHVLLARLEETATFEGVPFPLAANEYPGAIHPQGHLRLAGFALDPWPTWTWEVGGAVVTRRLFLVRGEDTLVVSWRSTRAGRLRVEPLLAFRDYHALARANDALDGAARAGGGVVRLRPYPGLPELRLHHSAGPFEPGGEWRRDLEYALERERGLDSREDLWRAGALDLELAPGGAAWLVATLGDAGYDDLAVARIEREERARRTPARRRPGSRLLARLEAAADAYVVRRAGGLPTIVAGYPWFTDWGRDTMIALPGLLVARGRLAEARDVLRGFLDARDRGLVPNRFPDRGERPEYNTADATLWLFQAAHALERAGGDRDFVLGPVYEAGAEIAGWHGRGTHHGIRVDPADGLLVAGDAGTQLTWMDAKVGDWVVTPRHGKPVEVNALWYGALRLLARWARERGEPAAARAWRARAARVGTSFQRAFWNPARGHLHDVVRPEGPDPRLRPNQLLAVSLPHSPLAPPLRRAVVDAVEAALLTPVGLRTLAPGEPEYRPRYRGGPRERDGAYHQGAVWPWLLGPFVRAWLRVHGRTPANVARCRALLDGLEPHLEEACLGQVSEIFEAEPPFGPAGAPAQAWSVAQLLELLLVDLAAG